MNGASTRFLASSAGAVVTSIVAVVAVAAPACDSTFRFDEPAADAGSAVAPPGDAGDAATGQPPQARTPCADDTACGGARCDVAAGVCVACLGDGDCKDASRAFCASPSGLCVECRTSDQCGTKRRCETTTHRCLDACNEEFDPCPGVGFVCDEDRKTCIECRSSANCAGNPGGPVCDTLIGRCVECASSAQCPTEKPACDRRSGRCVGCITSVACGTGRLCDPTSLTCRDP